MMIDGERSVGNIGSGYERMTSVATPAIETLLQIMDDEEVSTRQRIEACEALLGYEAPPEVVAQARDYLVAVVKDQEEVLHDRMDALKLARKFEAAKVTPRTIHTTRRETDRRETWRNYEIAARELKIILATKDTPPPGWADDLYSDDYVPPPEGWPGPTPTIPLKDLVVARRARHDRMEREAIEAASAERLLTLKPGRGNGNGNGGDEPSGAS
jgi:hypothetical protein